MSESAEDMVERAETLMDRGRDALDYGLPDAALAIADELEAMRYSGAFEMRALALVHLGRQEEAVRTLRAGLERAPTAWLLESLLGNTLSDLGRYDEAVEAFERGIGLDGADSLLFGYNHALVLDRAGKPTMARARLSEALRADQSDPDPALVALVEKLAERLGLRRLTDGPPQKRRLLIRRPHR